MPVYTTRAKMLMFGRAGAPQSMHIAYTGKPMSLGDMDQDGHTAMIVHTI